MTELTMKSREKSKATVRQMKIKTQKHKSLGHSEISPNRKSHGNTSPPQKQGKAQINNQSIHPKELEQEQQTKP